MPLTTPYMQNGSLSTLHDVVDYHVRGRVENELRDARIRARGLTRREKDDLLSFLRSLTGDNVDTIVADAFAAAIGDITTADPNWGHRK